MHNLHDQTPETLRARMYAIILQAKTKSQQWENCSPRRGKRTKIAIKTLYIFDDDAIEITVSVNAQAVWKM